jgi:hypothetical protein
MDEQTTPQPEQTVVEKPKKTLKRTLISLVVLIIVILIAGGIYIAYGPASSTKTKLLNSIPYPISYVGGKPIFYKQVAKRLEVAEKNNAGSEQVESSELKSKIVENIVEEQKLELTADKYGVSTNDDEIGNLFSQTVESAAGGDSSQFETMLSDFGLTSEEFKNDILKPQVLYTNLVVWFNSKQDLHSEIYKELDEIKQKMSNGESFESLAKQYSDDETSKDLEGDMGKVEISQVIPEISKQVSGMQQGEIKVVPSRYGVHYIKLEGKDDASKEYHLKQIFLEPTANFRDWYEEQSKQFKVTRIVKNI